MKGPTQGAGKSIGFSINKVSLICPSGGSHSFLFSRQEETTRVSVTDHTIAAITGGGILSNIVSKVRTFHQNFQPHFVVQQVFLAMIILPYFIF